MSLPNLELEDLEDVVLDKCDSFVRLGIWPSSERLNYRGWLNNFGDDADKVYALHLLNSFCFYNSELCAALFYGSIQTLSIAFASLGRMTDSLDSWRSFLNSAVFVPVEGETPNITDSGALLANMLRKSLWIPEGSIRPLDELLKQVFLGYVDNRPVVFFDDFIGSGQQFIRMMTTSRAGVHPYNILAAHNIRVHYNCFVTTTHGLMNITNALPNVVVSPAHTLDDSYSVVSARSRVWPAELRPGVDSFIARASTSAGIPDVRRLGFHSLALCIAFDHTIPDATLPLFYESSTSWQPLMVRH